jgi:hypothetical protein
MNGLDRRRKEGDMLGLYIKGGVTMVVRSEE